MAIQAFTFSTVYVLRSALATALVRKRPSSPIHDTGMSSSNISSSVVLKVTGRLRKRPWGGPSGHDDLACSPPSCTPIRDR